MADLKAGAHVKGTTIAELGNRNRPLDMIVYQKDGKDFILMTNSNRGVMKIPTEGAGTAPGITARVSDKQGLGYDTIASLKNVNVFVVALTRSVTIKYTAKHAAAPRDMTSPTPNCACW